MNTLLNTISHLRWALFKPTLWLLVILNKPVFDNTCLQVPATDSASPVVRVSVPLSSHCFFIATSAVSLIDAVVSLQATPLLYILPWFPLHTLL